MPREKINFGVLQIDDKYNTMKRDYSFYELWELYKKTKLDGTFQRWGGVERGSGWSYEEARAWLSNALQGSTINTIVIAKVSSCLKFADEEKCTPSINYFSDVKDGGDEFVSMDGNNSTSTVYHFLENHPEIYLTIEDKKTYFKDLSADLQKAIQNRQRITVHEFREILVDEMCDEFRNFNTSCGLNAQEWRQARWSDMSAFIMAESNTDKTREMFKKLVSACREDNKLDLRTHEELVAQLAMKIYYDYDTDIKKEDLNGFYEKLRALGPGHQRRVTQVLKALEQMTADFKEGKCQRLAKGTFHNLVDFVYSILYEFDMKILDHSGVFQWFEKKDDKFKEEAKQVVEEDKEDLSYIYWTTTYNKKQYYEKTKQKFAEHFVADLDSLEAEQVVKCKRTSKDNFTSKQKRKLLELQNYQTRCGQKITIYDLINGKVEADHVRSFNDGGKATISNGELMLKETNRRKGKQSWSPYFEFQIRKAAA
jgi:hypothetical protein